MAIGDIGAIIDSETWAAGDRYFPYITHATGDIYIITEGSGFRVRTVSIDSDGNIGPVIDAFTLDGGLTSSSKDVLHVDGDVYAVAYAGAANVVVQTFTCDASGNLGGAAIDTEILSGTPANKSFFPYMLRASGNIFIVAYTDNNDDGWLKTLRINNDGTIDPFLDSWEHEAAQGRFPWLINIQGNVFCIVTSSTAANWGHMRTFTVDVAGNITDIPGPAGDYIFDPAANSWNGGMILRVSGNFFLIVYQDQDFDGDMMTIEIANDGTITTPFTDSWEFNPTQAAVPHAILASPNAAGTGQVFCIVFGANSVAQVITVEVLNNGTITTAIIDSLILVPADWADSVSIKRVNDELGIYVACYEDLTGANSGEADTFEIEGEVIPIVTTNPATEVT